MTKKKKKSSPIAPKTIAFDYIKSNSFHSIQADGVIGSITPNQHIHMAFFNERSAIPRRVIHELKEDGSLGKLSAIESRGSIVREMNIDVFMTLDVAKSVHQWLEQTIKEVEAEAKGK